MFSACLIMPSPLSVLQCLSANEEKDFLPAPLTHELAQLASPLIRVDPDGLDESAWAEQLHAANPEVLIACWLTPPLPETLPPALRYVCYLAGSVKKLVPRHHIENGLRVTNWGGSISRIVAEGALVHILTCLRGLTHWTVTMHREGSWKTRDTRTASLFGRRVGLRGYGRVAHELIALLQPFGCDIGVFAPDFTAETARADGHRCIPDLETLMRDNDVVVELAPLIPATHGSIKERHLRLLRPGSVFVNVGRGATVDEAALLKVAREGNIFVGLDVFSEEPLPADSGFRGLLNVALSPHLAGPTTDRRVDAGRHGLANLAAYAAGLPLQGEVTLEVYDRST